MAPIMVNAPIGLRSGETRKSETDGINKQNLIHILSEVNKAPSQNTLSELKEIHK